MKKIIANFTAILIATIILLFATTSYANEQIHEHNYIITNSVAATSSDNGYTGDTVCSVCNEVLSKGTTIQKIKTVTFSSNSYIYDGKVKKPSVTVTDNKGKKLVNNTDYVVKYGNSNSKNAGKYTVTVQFKGNYSGSRSTNYYIFKPELSSNKFTYSGSVKKPTIKINYGGNNYLNSNKYTVKYTNNKSKNIGKYNLTVTLKNGYKGSQNLSYEIRPKNTSIKSYTTETKKIKINLNKVSNISGYYIQYATDKNFTKNLKKVYLSSKYTSKTISDLSPATNYYVRVKTYKKVGKTNYYATNWSSVKTITTKTPNNPTKPTNLTATVKDNTITVKWTQTKYTTGYQLQWTYNDDPEFDYKKSRTITDKTATTQKITGLEYKEKYHIRVRSYHTVNGKKYYSSWVKVKSAAVGKDPNKTYVTFVNEDHDLTVETKYSWECSYDGYIQDDTYHYTKEQIAFMKSECNKIANSVKAKLPENANEFDKFYFISEWITNNITYDVNYKEINGYNAYKYKRTACGGYATLLRDIGKKLGLTVYYVRDTGHAWNMIVLNGYAYECNYSFSIGKPPVDVMWDEYLDYFNYYKTPLEESYTNFNSYQNMNYHITATKSKYDNNFNVYWQKWPDNPELWIANDKIKTAANNNNIGDLLYYVNTAKFYDESGILDQKMIDYEIEACNRGFMFYPEDFLNEDGSFNHNRVENLLKYVDAWQNKGYTKFSYRKGNDPAYVLSNDKGGSVPIYVSRLDNFVFYG